VKTNDQHRTTPPAYHFLSGGRFVWKKSAENVWATIEGQLVETKSRKVLSHVFRPLMAAAAILMLLISGSLLFMRFYSTSISTPAGVHQMAKLPDGSTVHLNAASELHFHPYWWRFDRSIEFEGEALFEVEKGRKFTVRSTMGQTEVLGTSFNIFSRETSYRVVCLSGSVKVSSKSSHDAVLKPGSKAEIGPGGTINVQHQIDTYPEISWKQQIFLFNASPLNEVFRELERQYDVSIKTTVQHAARYTGNFNKEQNIEAVLAYICPAMGLKYEKQSANEYLILPGEE
jgi:ferric-dicitrate binding protein FerR (iron transport regulator)